MAISHKKNSPVPLNSDHITEPFFAGVQIVSQAMQYNYRGCLNLLVKHDYVQAIADFSRAIHLLPNEPAFYWHRAEAYVKVSDYDGALMNFRQHEYLTTPENTNNLNKEPLPPSSGPHHKLVFPQEVADGQNRSISTYVLSRRMGFVAFIFGQCLFDQQRFHDSLVHFKLAKRLEFNIETVLLRMVLSKIGLGEINSALEDLYTLINIQRHSVDLYILRAKIYKCLNNPDSVNIDLQKAIRLSPQHPEIHGLQEYVLTVAVDLKNKASESIQKKQLNNAIWYLNRAIELDPQDWTAVFKRGVALAEIQDYDGALEDLLSILSNNIRDTCRDQEIKNHVGSIYNKIGIMAYQTGTFDIAISKFTEALLYNSLEPAVWKNRADSLMAKKEYASALRDLYQCHAISPDSKEYSKSLAVALTAIGTQYIMQGRYQDAIKELEQAITFDYTSGDGYYEYARANYFLGQIQIAWESLNMALQLDPNHQGAQALKSLLVSVPNMDDLGPLPKRRPLQKSDVMSFSFVNQQNSTNKSQPHSQTNQTIPLSLSSASKHRKTLASSIEFNVEDSTGDLNLLIDQDETNQADVSSNEVLSTLQPTTNPIKRVTVFPTSSIPMLPALQGGPNPAMIARKEKYSLSKPLSLRQSDVEKTSSTINNAASKPKPKSAHRLHSPTVQSRSIKERLHHGALLGEEMGSTIDAYLNEQNDAHN
ncbi:Tetratricopeptide repeat protein 16, variant 2 [Batrachochytrium dendrobatidis]|nr:Tetratricopeptide repeat protein 16, variant 2 [Batrachochytrium dendrobatidis]